MPHLFIFGFGYTARALAQRLAQSEFTISATARSQDGAAAITQLGHRGFVFSDDTAPSTELKTALQSATHFLSSAPPGTQGDPVLTALAEDITRMPNLVWLGYFSTIGVYGDHNGAWIDEETLPHPQSNRSKHRLKAEHAWQQLARSQNVPLSIFRLAGIYGPGRSAIDRIRAGSARAIIKPGQVFNRIHVEDAAATVAASLNAPDQGGGIYNLSDDLPAPPEDVIQYAAKLLNAPPPALISLEKANLSDMARSFYSENKRAKNQRIKDNLGVELQYPTFKEGLQAIAGLTQGCEKDK